MSTMNLYKCCKGSLNSIHALHLSRVVYPCVYKGGMYVLKCEISSVHLYCVVAGNYVLRVIGSRDSLVV